MVAIFSEKALFLLPTFFLRADADAEDDEKGKVEYFNEEGELDRRGWVRFLGDLWDCLRLGDVLVSLNLLRLLVLWSLLPGGGGMLSLSEMVK